MNEQDWYIVFLFCLGAIIMRAAGCVINDLWDKNLDQKVARTQMRPLASGALSRKQALLFLFLLLLSGLTILIQMSFITILLGILSLPLIILYPLMKRITWWPQAFLGIIFNFGVLMGWAATSGILELPALILYGSAALWTLGYDTIYAHQDKEDDALIGIKSTALKFGENSALWVKVFYILSWILLAISASMAFKSFFTPFLLLPALLHIFWQIKMWRINSPQSALEIFKSNRNYGIIVLAGLALGQLFT